MGHADASRKSHPGKRWIKKTRYTIFCTTPDSWLGHLRGTCTAHDTDRAPAGVPASLLTAILSQRHASTFITCRQSELPQTITESTGPISANPQTKTNLLSNHYGCVEVLIYTVSHSYLLVRCDWERNDCIMKARKLWNSIDQIKSLPSERAGG